MVRKQTENSHFLLNNKVMRCLCLFGLRPVGSYEKDETISAWCLATVNGFILSTEPSAKAKVKSSRVENTKNHADGSNVTFRARILAKCCIYDCTLWSVYEGQYFRWLWIWPFPKRHNYLQFYGLRSPLNRRVPKKFILNLWYFIWNLTWEFKLSSANFTET